ncbi:MAG: helicase C-terminal domain-containing protein [Promethearchaeota archaeon]
MKFCPKCESLLYPKKKQLYCKTCGISFDLDNEGMIIQAKKRKNDNFDEKDIKKLSSSSQFTKNNYLKYFPYKEFRTSQENIISQIEDAVKSRNNILLVAPNGTGKTIIALSAILPIALEKDLKILYMCRTHSQNTRVIKELKKISDFLSTNDIDQKIRAISIRGRNEMCLNKTLLSMKLNPHESMTLCSDLRRNRNCIHFLNLNKKRNEFDDPLLISPEIFDKPIDAEELINFCKEKKVCPYFLSKYLLEKMKVIICNYQWIFNPHIRATFLEFIDQQLEKCILIIDECHNIIDVATEVNSQWISPYSLKICLKDLEMYQSQIKMQNFVNLLLNHLENRNNSLIVEEKSLDSQLFLQKICERLGFSDLNAFKTFIEEMSDFSVSIHDEKVANGEIYRDYLGSLADFWLKWMRVYLQDNYFFCYSVKEKKEKKTISLEIVALDPREIVTPILKNCHSCLNLSGTVNPYVFNNLMGLNASGKKYKGIIAESPFKKKNIKALIIEGVDTKKNNRTPNMYKKMIEKINEVLFCTPANVGIFCASYKILRGLLSNGIETIVNKNKKKIFIEKNGLSASENALMIQDFKSMALNGGAVLLGVCGGRNSEGEDYPGDTMNSVIIAGFPYHLPTPRVEAKINYYDKVFNRQGWNFAYLYPAIQRANQASGRPIRKIKDKGALIFMDSRFKSKLNWISNWIKEQVEIVPDKKNEITQILFPFWDSN